MGSSTAYHLLADPAFKGRVVVIEKDPTYQLSASALSAASIRQQYSSAVNIRISLYGIQFLREIGDRLGLTEGTVKWYMQQIYDKLGVRRRPQAVIRARQFGILA